MIVNYSDESVIKNQKSIFLAGPTPRKREIESWRKYAIKKLEELGFNGVIYVPECSDGKAKSDYVDQAMWERLALTEASVVLFWVPREVNDMPAFTTNVEFGYWINRNKIIYGRPDNAPKMKYLDWLYELDYNQKPINNLDILLQQSISLANRMYKLKQNTKSIQELIKLTVYNPRAFYEEIARSLSVEEYSYIQDTLLNKSCNNCSNMSCSVPNEEKSYTSACYGWENNELVGRSKILQKKDIYDLK